MTNWADVMMDALRESDGGNNPFYSDDEDTISLASQLGEAVVAHLRTLHDPDCQLIDPLHSGPHKVYPGHPKVTA